MEFDPELDEHFIILSDNLCIQCSSELDLEFDDFTLYQAKKGQHYLYCDNCKSLYEPIPDYTSNQKTIVLSKPFNTTALVTFIIGLVIGWYLLK